MVTGSDRDSTANDSEFKGTFDSHLNRLAEIEYFHLYNRTLEDSEKQRIADHIQNSTPSTLCGVLLQSRSNIADGRYLTGFNQIAESTGLIDGFDGVHITKEITEHYLENELLPTRPSVHTVLYHIYNLQQFD